MDKISFCSCILCVAPSLAGPQTPLVYDNRKKDSSWAFPGGNPIFLKKLGRLEYPMETARRKLRLETGIIAGKLEPIEMIEKSGHQWHLF